MRAQFIHLISVITIISEYHLKVLTNPIHFHLLPSPFNLFFYILIVEFAVDLFLVLYLILLVNRFMGKIKYSWKLITIILLASVLGRLHFVLLLYRFISFKGDTHVFGFISSLFGISILISSYMILISISHFFFNRTRMSASTKQLMTIFAGYNVIVFVLSGFMLILPLISVLLYYRLSLLGSSFSYTGVLNHE